MPSFTEYQRVQSIAKEVLREIGPTIRPSDTEKSIAARAIWMLAQRGIRETWYYDCPAFVLVGSRSKLSCSGRDYVPSHEHVGDENLVTVDLSPLFGEAWGDCARSFAIERGAYTSTPVDPEFREGLEVETSLHLQMRSFAKPATRFNDLYEFANESIARAGYLNLDFHGNVGHSIAVRRADRCFLEQGCSRRLGDVQFFTFEPHVCKLQGRWGFKHENIYYFSEAGTIEEL